MLKKKWTVSTSFMPFELFIYEDYICFSLYFNWHCLNFITLNQDTASDIDDEVMVKLIEVKERRALAEEIKANALERKAATSEKKTGL